ncbi:hypothetical protein DITRI_Ditri01bG0177600 [Diplodiscus trichospermus]
MSSSSLSSSLSQQKYDVFLSFRGEDTRKNFTDHLYAALKRRGIVTFKDDRNLEAGEEIAPELFKAIQESWCSVIVFSKTYTFSSWCLEELAAIVQQKKDTEHKASNVRSLAIDDISSSLRAFKELFRNVKELILKNVRIREHKNVVPSVDPEGLNELTSLWLESCNDMKYLMDTTREKGQTKAFSNLVKLHVVRMSCLNELCHGPPPIMFLQKLKDVIIWCCKELKVVFQMGEVLEKEEISGLTLLFSNLTSLELVSLPELKSIWKLQPTHQNHVSLRNLKVVTIRRCLKLKSIFSSGIVQSLLHLQHLTVKECHGLEQVFDFPQKVVELEIPPLSNLTCLELYALPKLRCIWKGPTRLANLQSLKTLKITFCSKLAYLFPSPLAQSLVTLEVLVVNNCESLERIIIKEAAESKDQIVSNMDDYYLCCPKLKVLNIIGCRSLKYVFPITLAKGLPYLEFVEISWCSQLKQVFKMTKEKGGRSQQDIVLRRLRILILQNLEKLSSFCPKKFVGSLSLKEFKVRNCPRLTRFINQQGVALQGEFEDFPLCGFKDLLCNAKKLKMDRVIYHKNLIPNVDPEVLNKLTFLTLERGEGLECLIDTTDQGHVFKCHAFFNLVELVIREMSGLKMLCNGRFPKGFMRKLERLEVKNCMEMVSLSPALQNIKKVRIMNCGQLQEVFETEELLHDIEENQAPLLSNLTSLELKLLPELKWIWKGTCSHVCLRRLKVAEIYDCNRLKYLFSPSLAQSLVLLEQLKVEHCKGLKDIIARELKIDDNRESDNGNLHPPLFPQLMYLYINCCPRLEYVFKIPLAQGLPHLKFVRIVDAPRLKQVFNVAKEKNNEVDHNSIALPRLQHLELKNLRNLRCFCSENYTFVSPSLEDLTVEACPRLENFATQQVNKEFQGTFTLQLFL